MRIIVSGIIGQYALAGLSLHYAQIVLGLRELGHDVYYVEDNGAPPFNPLTQNVDVDYSHNLPHLRDLFAFLGLSDRWAYMDFEGGFQGMPAPAVREQFRTPHLRLKVSGATVTRDEHRQIPRRAFLDTDPGFQHFAIAVGDPVTIEYVAAHNVFLTFAENIGKPECRLPTDRFHWQPWRQPVCLSLWEPTAPIDGGAFTTVTNWSAYKPVEFRGETYGQKEIELRRFMDLPARTEQPMELALVAPEPVKALLRSHGWRLRDPQEVTLEVRDYQGYIGASRAEWSVAKNAYVKTWSGWISERDINYLAAGTPVLSQDTGFSENVPVGEGFLAFGTMAECLDGIRAINADYAFHCRRAREMAEEHFAARVVLPPLLERCMA
jgi:hypothetical protein